MSASSNENTTTDASYRVFGLARSRMGLLVDRPRRLPVGEDSSPTENMVVSRWRNLWKDEDVCVADIPVENLQACRCELMSYGVQGEWSARGETKRKTDNVLERQSSNM